MDKIKFKKEALTALSEMVAKYQDWPVNVRMLRKIRHDLRLALQKEGRIVTVDTEVTGRHQLCIDFKITTEPETDLPYVTPEHYKEVAFVHIQYRALFNGGQS